MAIGLGCHPVVIQRHLWYEVFLLGCRKNLLGCMKNLSKIKNIYIQYEKNIGRDAQLTRQINISILHQVGSQQEERFFLHLLDISLHLYTFLNSEINLKKKIKISFDKNKRSLKRCDNGS